MDIEKELLNEINKALKNLEVPVAAILIYKDNIFKAHNSVQTSNNPLNHAEAIVINKALKSTSQKYLLGAKLYSTLEPCPMCAMMVSLTRISEVHFMLKDKNYGAYTKLKMHKLKIFKPKLSIIKNKTYKELFQNFFKKLRT
ncbi:MAG: nucleoside deaminase [bacterium]|nr:nucleoside deaminase [bacterium]